MSFDWQTQEEINWDEPPPLPEEPRAPRPRRRLWPYVLLMVVVGAATAVFITIRELNQRVEDAEAEARLAVISSYNVIQQAAADQDSELFVGFLSGKDAHWSAAQEEVVREGAFLDRDGLGLQRLNTVTTETAVITFSPDLTAAEMTITQTYGVDIGNGLSQTVQLQQTAVYRLGPNRWLLAPPEPEFWGETLTSNGRYLTTTYPERDAEIGRRLAADLDRKLIEMCEQLAGINCPTDLHFGLQLTTDPRVLLDVQNGRLPSDRSLRLPTPTLIGLPQDEASYRALQRGYAEWVVTAVISNLAGWLCCDHELFFQAIVDIQLQQLGLQTLPPLPYNQIQEEASQLDAASDLWDRPYAIAQPMQRQIIYALIEFLTVEIGISTHPLQRELGDITYRSWLFNVTGDHFTTYEDAEQAWQLFLAKRAS